MIDRNCLSLLASECYIHISLWYQMSMSKFKTGKKKILMVDFEDIQAPLAGNNFLSVICSHFGLVLYKVKVFKIVVSVQA